MGLIRGHQEERLLPGGPETGGGRGRGRRDGELPGLLPGNHGTLRSRSGRAAREVLPGETRCYTFQVYLGPTNLENLKAGWPELDDSLQFIISVGIIENQFAKFLLSVLNWFHAHVIANYGLAVIFLTVLVRVAMLPLTLKGMKSMKKMQKLGPEMED